MTPVLCFNDYFNCKEFDRRGFSGYSSLDEVVMIDCAGCGFNPLRLSGWAFLDCDEDEISMKEPF